MKKFLKLIAFAFVFFTNFTGFAEAQTSRNPCFLNGTQSTQGVPSCESVSTSAPLPVTTNGTSSASLDISVSTTPTVQNAAYSSGNAIGGLQTIAFFRTVTQPSGILNNIRVASQGGSTAAMTLYIFNANPSASTCTDKVAFVLNSADVSKLIATTPPVLTPAVVGVGTTVTMASQQLPVSVKNTDSTATINLYVCAVTAGYTPASTSDLVFKFAGIQD